MCSAGEDGETEGQDRKRESAQEEEVDFPLSITMVPRGGTQSPTNLSANQGIDSRTPLVRRRDTACGGRLGGFADRRLPGYYFFPTGEITISFFVVSTTAKSSFCSCSGTLNLSKTFLKSAPIACHSFSVMLRC